MYTDALKIVGALQNNLAAALAGDPKGMIRFDVRGNATGLKDQLTSVATGRENPRGIALVMDGLFNSIPLASLSRAGVPDVSGLASTLAGQLPGPLQNILV